MNHLLKDGMLERDAGEFFEWVKHRAHLSRGVTIGTMLKDEAFYFIRLGTFLERADNTARILDVKFHGTDGEQLTGLETDCYHWATILRSVSAFETYRKAYRDFITPERVAELLILRGDMPRSLMACMIISPNFLSRFTSWATASAVIFCCRWQHEKPAVDSA